MSARESNIEHLVDQGDFVLRQQIDQRERIGCIVVVPGRGEHLRVCWLVDARIVHGKSARKPTGQPDSNRKSEYDDRCCNESRV